MESLHALDICRLTDTLTNILRQRPTVNDCKKVPISFQELMTEHQAWWVWAAATETADGIFIWKYSMRSVEDFVWENVQFRHN